MTSSGPAPVVVVPRERFSGTLACLQHIYAFTDAPFRCIVVDGGSPRFAARELEAFASVHEGCEVVRSERFLLPFEARQLALEQLSGEDAWLAFVDNDVKVGPGWLRLLLEAAAETGARAVHPLYLIEEGDRLLVHMSYGELAPVTAAGATRYRPVMVHKNAPIDEVAGLERRRGDFLEFHAFAIRRSLLDEVSPLPPGALAEELELSLLLRERGEPIVFEPRSVVTYVAGPPFESSDRAFFQFRWGSAHGPRAVERMRARWPIVDAYWDEKLRWLRSHRHRIEPWFEPARNAKRRGRKLAQRLFPGILERR